MVRLTPSLPTVGLLLSLTLTACTGTIEEPLPVRLVVADATGLRTVGTTLSPNASAAVAGTQGALVVRTLAGGQQVAVLFPDRVEVRDARQDNLPLVQTLPRPAGLDTPCYTKMNVDAGRTRLALLSSCPNTQTPVAAFINTRNGVAWSQVIPAPNVDPNFTFVVLTGPEGSEQLTALRRTIGGGTEVLRADRNTTFQQNGAFTTGALNDAAVFLGRVYAASNVDPLGVLEVEGGKLGARLNDIQNRSDRLFSDARLLISYDDAAKSLTFSDGGRKAVVVNSQTVPDVTVAPDGFAYALTDAGSGANAITRYDTVQGLTGRPFDSTGLGVTLQAARSITWTVQGDPAN